MNIFVIDTDWKRRGLMTFSLSKDGITAVPLVPSDAIDTSRTEPQLFLVCDQPETRALLATLPPQSAAFCYADEVQLRNVVTALQAGAADYFAWPDDFGELVERIRELQALDRREAANGATFGDPRWNPEPRRMGGYPRQTSLAASGGVVVVDHPSRPNVMPVPEATATTRRQRANDLSARELEVLQLASHGLSSQSIAERLGIRRKTVEAHRNSILIKTRSNNMAEAVRWGIMGRII